MTKMVLLFKRPAQAGAFERRYQHNLDLLKKMPGVRRVEVGKVAGSPAGESPYNRVLEIFFDDFAALDAALTSPEGVAAGKDLMEYAVKEVEIFFVETEDSEAKKPLTPIHLQAYLDENHIPAEIIFPSSPTPTVEAAAKVMGVDPDQIVKSVVFLVDERPFLVIACGMRRVDPRKLAQRLQINRKLVVLADAEQVLALTGYPVGTVPPIGLKTPMPVYMDPTVQQYETIYAGGGGLNALLKIKSADLREVSKAEVVSLQHEGGTEQAEP